MGVCVGACAWVCVGGRVGVCGCVGVCVWVCVAVRGCASWLWVGGWGWGCGCLWVSAGVGGGCVCGAFVGGDYGLVVGWCAVR